MLLRNDNVKIIIVTYSIACSTEVDRIAVSAVESDRYMLFKTCRLQSSSFPTVNVY